MNSDTSRGFRTVLKSLGWRGFLGAIELYRARVDGEVKIQESFFSIEEGRWGVSEIDSNSCAGSAKNLKMSAVGCNFTALLECYRSDGPF